MVSDRSLKGLEIAGTIYPALRHLDVDLVPVLMDELLVLVRASQADAWTRGYAAAQLDEFNHVRGIGGKDRVNPFRGGKHARHVESNLWTHPAPEPWDTSKQPGKW